MRHLLTATLILAAACAAGAEGDAQRDAHARAAALAEQAFAELDKVNAAYQREDPVRPLLQKAREITAPPVPAPVQTPPKDPSAAVTTTLISIATQAGDPVTELERVIATLGVEKGVKVSNGQTIIIATGMAQCAAPSGSPGWIEARSAAAQLATLRARAGIAAAIAEEVSSGRQVSLIEEPSVFIDGQLPAASAAQIAERARSAAEKQLDEDLKRLGVPPAQVAAAKPEEKRALLSERYSAELSARAAASLAGTATLAVTEGNYQGSPCVVVAVVWSQNLARLSQIALRVGDRLPPRAPAAGVRLAEQIPDEPRQLARRFGVQRVVDESGDITLVAYGQAAVPAVAQAMRGTALNAAFEKAGLEARAALKDFVVSEVDRESLRAVATLAQATRGAATGALGARTQQEDSFTQSIRQRASTLSLAGAGELRRWNAAIDGVEAAGVVVSWSPRRMTAAAAAQKPGVGGSDVRAEPGAKPPAGAGGAGTGTSTFDPSW